MSTATPSSQKSQMEEGAVPETTGSSLQHWLLILQVFVGGATVMAVEMSASRLLAPYFGTSLFVWANLIGLILLYLTVGYYIGGRVADRYPSPKVFYGLTIVAAILISLIPPLSRPILGWSLSAFSTFSIGVFYGSLVSVIFLFAIPMVLLGFISPYAIRLSVEQVGKSGRTAGLLYAISTGGSIAGTFLSVLALIPAFGTYRTFWIFSLALLLVSILGLVVTLWKRSGKSDPGMEERLTKTTSKAKSLLLFLLVIPVLLTPLTISGSIKPASGTGGGVLLTERESPYNYIQVVQSGSETQLVLNEGLGIHSIYDPNKILTQGPWDYFMVAPYFNAPPFTPEQVKRVCIIGLGAGTSPRAFTAVYGPQIAIDGVEIDGEIVDVGRKYFNMNEPNLNVIVQDGRPFLQTSQQQYDVIGIDAYQQPYIPFQLTTTEFFQEVKARLTPTGVTVINIGRTSDDFRLVDAMAQNMRTVFSNVYIIDTERFTNSLVIATNAPTSLENFRANTSQLTNPLLLSVAQSSFTAGNIREENRANVYFTDDRAPVEQLIDQLIFSAAQKGSD